MALAKGEWRRRGKPRLVTGPLAKVAEAYLEHRRGTVERATWGADRTALRHLLDRVDARDVLDVDVRGVQAMVGAMVSEGYQATTLGTYAKSIRIFLRWCGLDTLGELRLPHPGEGDGRTLEPEELERLRAAASRVDRTQTGRFPSARLAVEIGLSMGLRQGEIFALRWEAIDTGAKSARVQWQIPKDGTTPKPLKGKLARTTGVLQEWWPLHRTGASGYIVGRNGRPVGTRTQRNLITRVLDVAGLNEIGLGWHLLRHTFARQFLERGGEINNLQKSLGHRSIRTTERRYGHFRDDVAWSLARSRIYGVP